MLNPLNKLFAKSKQLHIVAVGTHVLLSDGTIREIIMTPKLADAILGFISHRQGGKINLGRLLEIYISEPVSKEKEEDNYIPLSRQLSMGTLIQDDGGPCMCNSCVPE